MNSRRQDQTSRNFSRKRRRMTKKTHAAKVNANRSAKWNAHFEKRSMRIYTKAIQKKV